MTEPAGSYDGSVAMTEVFDAVYRGESPFGERPPWDIDEPQPALVTLEAAGLIRGAVLDAGCGTGEDSLHLAEKGYDVTGLDLSPTAVSIARGKAHDRSLDATFEVADALRLTGYEGQFDTVIDCGLAHTFDTGALRVYAAALRRACRPGARVHIVMISDFGAEKMQKRLARAIDGIPAPLAADEAKAPGLRCSPEWLREGFTDGWAVESITESRMRAIVPTTWELLDLHAWLGRFRPM